MSDLKVKVSISLPWALDEKCYAFTISRQLAEDSLAPLPRDRELDPVALFEAGRQHDRRKKVIEDVANKVAFSLMNACELEDTTNGCRRE